MDSKNIYIQIIEARSLSPSDINGFCDPYVIIYLNSKKIGSTDYSSRTLNPKWNTLIKKEIKTNYSEELKIIIYDHDSMSFDDILGQVTINLDRFNDGKWTNQWYRLKNHEETTFVRGYIRLQIQIADLHQNPFENHLHNLLPEENDEFCYKNKREETLRRRIRLINQTQMGEYSIESNFQETQDEYLETIKRQTKFQERNIVQQSNQIQQNNNRLLSMTKQQFYYTLPPHIRYYITQIHPQQADIYITQLMFQAQVTII